MITRSTCLLLIVGFALLGCSSRTSRPNQRQGVPSPSGKYVLRLPIEAQTTNPIYKETRVWKVTISDRSGKTVYKDEDSTMVGTLNVYWGWGKGDRVWLYNSDDGKIWRWEPTGIEWKKSEAHRTDGVPDFILPDYAKNQRPYTQ